MHEDIPEDEDYINEDRFAIYEGQYVVVKSVIQGRMVAKAPLATVQHANVVNPLMPTSTPSLPRAVTKDQRRSSQLGDL